MMKKKEWMIVNKMYKYLEEIVSMDILRLEMVEVKSSYNSKFIQIIRIRIKIFEIQKVKKIIILVKLIMSQQKLSKDFQRHQ